VVPSNEDRGYVLRRIMRRAIQQGRVLGLEQPWLGRFAERVIELMSGAYPHLAAEYGTVLRWVGDEEESFGRTLDRGTELLNQLIVEAKEANTSWIDSEDAFRLHDTYGFPYDLTRELLAEEGLSVDDEGFEALMEQQRSRARVGSDRAAEDSHEAVISFVNETPPSDFVGYETLRAETSVAAARDLDADGAHLVKLEESPFYAEGGGQVADSGQLRWDGGEAQVADVYRVGDDQAIKLGPSASSASRPGAAGSVASPPESGTRVEAVVDHGTRHATMRNHTATHLLHAALRERLGTHVRQAGSAVRPDKLRFDFTHGAPLRPEETRGIEDRVNEWIKASRPVRALHMSRAEAEELGAMALFGEKYGDWVRVIEVDDVSRELCGGTHVDNTA
jgi:alanyl-tRNA synthetase